MMAKHAHDLSRPVEVGHVRPTPTTGTADVIGRDVRADTASDAFQVRDHGRAHEIVSTDIVIVRSFTDCPRTPVSVTP